MRSYLRLNTPKLFTKIDRGHYVVREEAKATLAFANGAEGKSVRRLEIAALTLEREAFRFGNATLIHGDCFDWLAKAPTNSVEAVVTDPPYGLVEYSEQEQDKLRKGRGGVWRSRRHSMGISARRCRVSRCFRETTSANLSGSSSPGRGFSFLWLSRADMFWSRRIRSCHLWSRTR